GEKIYLFSHSTDYFYNVTRYNAIFYLLYKLEPGDEINLFYKGARYKYLVDELKIVNPSEVGYLTEKSGREELVLQTCWPLGTTFQRLLVFARPASEVAQN
ncbi:MAG: sortase, partial [Candidatus Paceibacterota bacterium]